VVEHRLKGCPLVFLSACYSLQNKDKESSKTNFGYVFIKHCGVKYVIGSKGKISRDAIAMFATYFYDTYLYYLSKYGEEEFFASFDIALRKTRNFYKEIINIGIALTITVILAIATKGLSLAASPVINTAIKAIAGFLLSYVIGWIIKLLFGQSIDNFIDNTIGLKNLDRCYSGTWRSNSGTHRGRGSLRSGFGGGFVCRHTFRM